MMATGKCVAIQELLRQYSGAIAYVWVKDSDGNESIGTAFHVGKGVFVTARHVVEGKKIVEIATTKRTEIVVLESEHNIPRIQYVEPRSLEVECGPYFSSDMNADVAVFRVSGMDPRTPRVPLGTHFDRFIDDSDYVLSSVIVLGYPPIPFTTIPYQVAASGQVNAVIDVRHSKYVHFVISTMARGGFSGGLVLSEYGYALGLVTESLIKNGLPPELGFMNVLSIEPIHDCISQHFDFRFFIDGVFGTAYFDGSLVDIRMTKPELARLNPRLFTARIFVYDDDRDVCVELMCSKTEDLLAAYSAFSSVVPSQIVEEECRPGYLFFVPTPDPPAQLLIEAAEAARWAFLNLGYNNIGH